MTKRLIARRAVIALAAVVVGCAVLGALVVTSTRASADPSASVRVVMSGLASPRGLAFGPQGALYVAEAGRGGAGLEDPFCFGAGDSSFCYGPTGAVSR